MSVKSIKSTLSVAIVTVFPSICNWWSRRNIRAKRFAKYINIVTGVLENFERMNTRSGSLKSYLKNIIVPFVVCAKSKRENINSVSCLFVSPHSRFWQTTVFLFVFIQSCILLMRMTRKRLRKANFKRGLRLIIFTHVLSVCCVFLWVMGGGGLFVHFLTWGTFFVFSGVLSISHYFGRSLHRLCCPSW